MIDLVVFDWDGTLSDSTGIICHTLAAAFEEAGFAAPSATAIRQIIGLELRLSIRTLNNELNDEELERVTEAYRRGYREAAAEQPPLFPAARELLSELSDAGFMLGVATGKSRRGLDRALEQLELGAYFYETRCADEAASKPNPEMLEYLIASADTTPEKTLMLGDTTFDLQMAKNARAHAAGVSFGAHSRAQLEALSPVFMVDALDEVRAALEKLN